MDSNGQTLSAKTTPKRITQQKFRHIKELHTFTGHEMLVQWHLHQFEAT